MVITQFKNAFPDMILTAFDLKVQEKKDGRPPEACRPLKKLEKTNVEQVDPLKVKQNNVEKVDPQKGDQQYQIYIKSVKE